MPDEGGRSERRSGTAAGDRRNLPIATVVVILCLIAALHFTIWYLAEPRTIAAQVEGPLPSVSYNRFAKSSSGSLTVSEERIRADLTAIAKQAKAVRTYGSTRGLERVPEIAAGL